MHKSWPGLKHICQWDDKFDACSENVKRILKSSYFKIKRRKCKTKKDVKLLHILFYYVSRILSKTVLVHGTPFYYQKPMQYTQSIWDERMRKIHCVDIKSYIF